MSDDDIIMEEINDDVILVSDVKVRKKAKSMISDVMIPMIYQMKDSRYNNRSLVALWYATVDILISFMEPSDVLSVLSNKLHENSGVSSKNSLSPAQIIPDDKIDIYISEVIEVGNSFLNKLLEVHDVMETDNIGELFPETVLECSLSILKFVWGVDHVRRAISEQIALMVRGINEASNFIEPVQFSEAPEALFSPKKKENKVDDVVSAIDTQIEIKTEIHIQKEIIYQPLNVPEGVSEAKIVKAYITNFVNDTGHNGWSSWIDIQTKNRMEETYLNGIEEDLSGHAGWVIALYETLIRICHNTTSLKAIIIFSNDSFLNYINNVHGYRYTAHEKMWSEIDNAIKLYDIKFKVEPDNLNKNHIETCDRKIREFLKNRIGEQ